MIGDGAGASPGTRPSNDHGAALDQALADLAVVGRLARHDLLAPSRIMGGFAKLLASEYSCDLDEKALDYVQFIRDNAVRMREMAHNLGALARLSDPQFRDVVPLSKVVGDIRDAFELEEAPVTIECDQLPTVSGDPILLRQAIENVIRSRVMHSELERTHFKLSACQGPDGVELMMSDDAAVIDARERAELECPPPEESTRNVGLLIARRVALVHGGSWTVASSSEEGTTLRFALPTCGATTPS